LSLIEAVVLAVVEGLTEFLPVSSTGHMILVGALLGMDLDASFAKAFIWIVQLPAILAVVLYFWDQLWPFKASAKESNAILMLWVKIGVAFVPSVVLGLLFNDWIEEHLHRPIPIAGMLFLGGILLVVLERISRKTACKSVADLRFPTALGIGLFQCIAMVPGTSRSAATIIGAMLLGASRPVAAEFSFFLAIPTMLGATVYSLYKHGANFTPQQWKLLAVGSVISFAVAYGVVAFLMNYIRKHDFKVFGYYRIALAIAVTIYFTLMASSG
jgi:undecaprenyl-diphosphatase